MFFQKFFCLRERFELSDIQKLQTRRDDSVDWMLGALRKVEIRYRKPADPVIILKNTEYPF